MIKRQFTASFADGSMITRESLSAIRFAWRVTGVGRFSKCEYVALGFTLTRSIAERRAGLEVRLIEPDTLKTEIVETIEIIKPDGRRTPRMIVRK